MNAEALDRLFERAILALILAILVFAPLALGAVDAREFLVVQALTMAVMLAWALRLLLHPKPRFFWPPLCWVVLAFALYAIARYFTADIEYVARQEMIQTLLYAFLFFAIVNNLASKESANLISFALIIVATGISCYAVWQFMSHSNRVWNFISPYPGRASGTYISPNNFSCFVELLLPLALAFILTGRIKPLTRILLAYAALVMGAGLVVTFSRGGWTAAAIGVFGLLAVLIFNRKHWLPALTLALVLIVGGSLFVTKYLSWTPSYFKRVKDIEQSRSIDLEYRAEMWKAAEQMWADHFWFGVGPAHYDYRFPQYRPENVQARPDRAHNDYLNLLADWGTTGGIIVAGGMMTFLFGLAKTWKSVNPDEHDFGRGFSNRFAFFLGASAGLLALAVHSVIDFNLHVPANALVGVSLLALLTGQLRFATDHYRFHTRTSARIFTVFVLAIGIAYFGLQGVRRARETYWVARAQNADLLVLDRAALLEKAFAIEARNFSTAYQIGELYRIQSFQGTAQYESQAQTAMQWYARAMKLDPYDGYNYLSIGMCLDWLDRYADAEPYYSQAERLDPNSYFTVANIGWHYAQIHDYPAADVWLQRSLRLGSGINPIAFSYRDIVESKLNENASGQSTLIPGY